MMRSVHKLSTPGIWSIQSCVNTIDHCFVESKVLRKYSILALLLQYQKCSNVQTSMLAYALLLTWNLEPPCGSLSLQSERGRERGREGGREGGRGRRREGGC